MIRIAMLSLAGLALITAAAHPTGAAAQSADVGAARVVYRDLDLSTDKGVARLYLRMEHGAQEVCSIYLDPADVEANQRFKACTADALARGVANVHSARLSDLHAQRSGGTAAEIETASAR